MQLELATTEAALLARLLESTLKELRVEVRRTVTRSLHDELQREEAHIRDLLVRLQVIAESD